MLPDVSAMIAKSRGMLQLTKKTKQHNRCNPLRVHKGISYLWQDGWLAGVRVERSWFETWPSHCVVFLRKNILLSPLSTQKYKWVQDSYQANLMKCWGGGRGEEGGSRRE